jgi:hypothetical protein
MQIPRLKRCLDVAELVAPYAVTKREHWTLMLAFLRSRLGVLELDDTGCVTPRSALLNRCTDEDFRIADQLASLNTKRGVRTRKVTS